MPELFSFPLSPEILEKWRALAEQRHAHFLELYMSGRWSHYYSEQEFIVRMREAIQLLEMWNNLVPSRTEEKPVSDDEAGVLINAGEEAGAAVS
jgi:uncharacterized repeat protein (TIGR03809 family)